MSNIMKKAIELGGDFRMSHKGIYDAIETYSPEFMHGLPKKDYLKFINIFTAVETGDRDTDLAYSMFEYLIKLRADDSNWLMFLNDALSESIYHFSEINND